jgi:hypothetical protein
VLCTPRRPLCSAQPLKTALRFIKNTSVSSENTGCDIRGSDENWAFVSKYAEQSSVNNRNISNHAEHGWRFRVIAQRIRLTSRHVSSNISANAENTSAFASSADAIASFLSKFADNRSERRLFFSEFAA